MLQHEIQGEVYEIFNMKFKERFMKFCSICRYV